MIVGIYDSNNGDKYEGDFKNGVKEGNGTFFPLIILGIMNYMNGDKYEGEWKDNMKNGHGNFTS